MADIGGGFFENRYRKFVKDGGVIRRAVCRVFGFIPFTIYNIVIKQELAC